MTHSQQKFLDSHKEELLSKSNSDLLHSYTLARKQVDMAFEQHIEDIEDVAFLQKILINIHNEIMKRMDKGDPQHV